MRNDKDRAITLRKNSLSYRKIVGLLQVPRSTLSEWFKDEEWSKRIKDELNERAKEKSKIHLRVLNATRGRALEKAYEEAREEARRELESLRHHPLFITGVMLYWGEGDKVNKHRVRLSNTDPALIKLFVSFLKDICHIPEAKLWTSVLIYPDLDEPRCRAYWSEQSGLPIGHFQKSVTMLGRHKTRRLSYGVCSVGISSAYFKVKMLEWIRLLSADLMTEEYYESI